MKKVFASIMLASFFAGSLFAMGVPQAKPAAKGAAPASAPAANAMVATKKPAKKRHPRAAAKPAEKK